MADAVNDTNDGSPRKEAVASGDKNRDADGVPSEQSAVGGQRTARAHTASLTLADFLPYRIAVLGRCMSEDLARVYNDENLTIPEWRVLAVTSQKTVMAARDVVANTPMDKMAVSRAVTSLEKKGLVRRATAPGDRRVSQLSLTPAGRNLFERIAVLALDYEQRLTASLSDNDRYTLDALLTQLEGVVSP